MPPSRRSHLPEKPNRHMGYEHTAIVIPGFTRNRFEGVGCMGNDPGFGNPGALIWRGGSMDLR